MKTMQDHAERRAVVYPVAGSNPKLWRIRAELIPDDQPGWFGGRVLWGHDKTTEKEADEVARAWVERGCLPPVRPSVGGTWRP